MQDNTPQSAPNTASMQAAAFARDGYVVVREVIPATLLNAVRAQVNGALQPLLGPVEFESDVGYPGAPDTRDSAGGQTPRRLLHAFARGGALAELAVQPQIAGVLAEIMGDAVYLSQSHHNCVMTKYPGYSSATLWHQDIRYWSFDRPELVSAWFATGDEQRRNGALRVIPRSHNLNLDRGRLDRDLFLRPELPENRELIHSAESVELQAGDVLLFHCRLFHAAGKNRSDSPKLTPVFTYHTSANKPIPGTRSASLPSLLVGQT